MKRLLAALVLLALPGIGSARAIRTYSTQESFDRSDLVVIGKPVAVRDTDENLPATSWGVQHGVEAEVQVGGILKGDPALKKVVLHYSRFDGATSPDTPVNPPFGLKEPASYLLFLVRDKEGRYVPFSGYDWFGISVIPLETGLFPKKSS